MEHVKAIQALMQERGVDALLLTDPGDLAL